MLASNYPGYDQTHGMTTEEGVFTQCSHYMVIIAWCMKTRAHILMTI